MTDGMGTLDFFLLEAGDYLERLDALSQTPAGAFTQSDEYVKVARALRGSALMATQPGMARAAQGIESVTRAVREGRLPWDERVRGEVIRAVDDCKILMRRLREAQPADVQKAEEIGARLDRLSGRSSAQRRAVGAGSLDAGARAFVARQAAAIASVLQRAAQTLAGDPTNRDVLAGVVPAMSALRGVAAITDLPPLGEMLAAIESAVKEVSALPGTAGAPVAEAFDAGARALARAAREVVDAGCPTTESDEARDFAARLLAAFTGTPVVVGIESLFYDDAGPHIVQQGAPPAAAAAAAAAAPAGYSRVEMVSQGEFLHAAATELRRLTTAVQRDLRLFAIAASLRPFTAAGGAPLPDALGRFADAARDAIARGAAGRAPEGFVAQVSRAAEVLSAVDSGDERQLADLLLAAVSALDGLEVASGAAAAPPSPVAARPATPPLAAPPAPAAAAAAAGPDLDILAASYLTFEQMIATSGLPLGSLKELLAGATPAPVARETVVPVESLAPDESVPIEALLYRGMGALQRIIELKSDIAAAAADPGDGARLRALLSEVFDLVELGLGDAR